MNGRAFGAFPAMQQCNLLNHMSMRGNVPKARPYIPGCGEVAGQVMSPVHESPDLI